jgi:hypothetical protein
MNRRCSVRALSAFALSMVLCFGACVKRLPEMVALDGVYDLVSLSGTDIPVELPNGQVLVGGRCSLDVRGEKFTMRFDYEGREPVDPIPDYFAGVYTFEIEADEQGRRKGQFVTDDWYMVGMGSEIYPDFVYDGPVSVLGDLLKVGAEDDYLVFRKRPEGR